MVYIEVIQNKDKIILNCNKGSKDGEFFRLIIDPVSKRVIERPEHPDIDASVAYSRIYKMMESGEKLPSETVAAWG